MYSSKHKVHVKADLGALSIHTSTPGKKNEYGLTRDKNSRWEGKQLILPNSNELFSSFPFSIPGKQDAYNERNRYRNVDKKLGFGSSEPPKRDEFSNTIAIEQYRETIRAVHEAAAKMAKQTLASQNARAGGDQALPGDGDDVALEEAEEKFEYDQAHSVQPDEIGKVRTWSYIDHGSMRTTNTNYGRDCEQPARGSMHARTTCTAQFFNNNHLRVGEPP